MNRKIAILGVLIGLIVVATAVFGIYAFTGQVVDNQYEDFDYEYTTAICDGNNCRDYNITCKDGKAIRTDPISGMVIFPNDWQDSRTDEDKELCGGQYANILN